MAVFWFGWTKKLKNIFTKKEADALYLPKTFETEINELKRLTTLTRFQSTQVGIGNSYTFSDNDVIDWSRPMFIGFDTLNGSNAVINRYGFSVYFKDRNVWVYLNEYVSVMLANGTTTRNEIRFKITNTNSNLKIGYITYFYGVLSLKKSKNGVGEAGV